MLGNRDGLEGILNNRIHSCFFSSHFGGHGLVSTYSFVLGTPLPPIPILTLFFHTSRCTYTFHSPMPRNLYVASDTITFSFNSKALTNAS